MEQKKVIFPRDESIHKEPIEWWYWNGHLKDAKGGTYAFMFCLFKARLPAWKPFWFTHALVTDVKRKRTETRMELFTKGLEAGAFSKGRLRARSGRKFLMEKTAERRYRLRSAFLDLEFLAVKPPLLENQNGFVDFGSSFTWYYSMPRLETTGRIVVDGKPVETRGLAWMDHQWSPRSFNREHAWTWFCFQLSDGSDLVCFAYGRDKKIRLATISFPDGSQMTTRRVLIRKEKEAWTSPETGARYPIRWTVRLPEFAIVLDARAKTAKQEMVFGAINYWEGPLRVRGTLRGKTVEGNGFLELVGIPMREPLARVLASQAKQAFGKWRSRLPRS